jgi:hypothetical protein
MAETKCTSILKSLGWCQGTPVKPGIRKRVYYVNRDDILSWPNLTRDDLGRVTSSTYKGNFTLAEGVKWQYIDHLPSKAEFKSETQGEKPSQTFKETVTLVHPGVGEAAVAATAPLLNSDLVFIVEDMDGKYRVVGSKNWDATATVSRDQGQGAAGTAGTTITLEASDEVDAPFYTGTIETEDGTINETVVS